MRETGKTGKGQQLHIQPNLYTTEVKIQNLRSSSPGEEKQGNTTSRNPAHCLAMFASCNRPGNSSRLPSGK